MSTNDEFRDELRDALGYTNGVDPDLVDMILTGYDIAGLDVTVAEVTYDSFASDLVPVRAEDMPRMLTAEGAGITIEFEISAARSGLSGQVDPPTPGKIILDQLGNAHELELHPSGSFAFDLNSGPFRLRLVTADGDSIATEWLEP